MAVAFSENEKQIIRRKLIDSAKECLAKYGVKKTTVDELVKMVGISKGAFYIFYNSKEALFFEVLEEFQKEIFNDILKNIEIKNEDAKQQFVDTIFSLLMKVKNSFLINIIKNNEIELIYRKLPEEIILKHDDLDEKLVEELIKRFRLKDKIDKSVLIAALRTIFMALLHEKEIGKYFDEAVKTLIEGLANMIFAEGENDSCK